MTREDKEREREKRDREMQEERREAARQREERYGQVRNCLLGRDHCEIQKVFADLLRWIEIVMLIDDDLGMTDLHLPELTIGELIFHQDHRCHPHLPVVDVIHHNTTVPHATTPITEVTVQEAPHLLHLRPRIPLSSYSKKSTKNSVRSLSRRLLPG